MWYIKNKEKEEREMNKKEKVELVGYMIRNWYIGDEEEVRVGEDERCWIGNEMVMSELNKKGMYLVMIRIFVKEVVREIGYKEVEKGICEWLVEWNKEVYDVIDEEEISEKEMKENLSEMVWK